MSTFWKVFITVVITAAIIGGGGWWYMNKKSDDDKAKLQTQIDNLNKELKDLKAENAAPTSSTSTTTPTTSTATSWKNYTNSKYGFSLTMNDIWKNFEVIASTPSSDDKYALDYLYVCVPTNSTTWQDKKSGFFCPFAITPVAAANKTAYETANDPMIPTFIAKNSSYAYYYSTAQDSPDDGVAVMSDIKNLVATFKAN